MGAASLAVSMCSFVAIALGTWYIKRQADEARRAYQAQAFLALSQQLVPAMRQARRGGEAKVQEDLIPLEALALSVDEGIVPRCWAADVWGPFLCETWNAYRSYVADWRNQPGKAKLFAHWEGLCREVAKSAGAAPAPDS